MSFWNNLFNFGKSALKSNIDELLDQALEKVDEEIDSHSGSSDEEKALMKEGARLLARRAEEVIKARL